MKLVPRNWSEFQHYKDRRPPWVKLHKTLLDDRDYQRLPIASRALAPMLWLLASESENGYFDASVDELTFRLRQPSKDIEAGLKPLIAAGFFILEHVDSDLLAGCQQLAVPETETEKRQSAKAIAGALFEKFWKAYPKKVRKEAARKAFDKRAPDDELTNRMVAAIGEQRNSTQWQKEHGQYIPHPATWLNDGRWEDEEDTSNGSEPRTGGILPGAL